MLQRNKRWLFWNWMLIGMMLPPLFAQSLERAGQDSLVTRYNRGLNTDEWEERLASQKETAGGIQLSLHETFSSSRLVSSSGDQWKDEYRLMMALSKQLTPSLLLNVMGSSLVFSDKQSGYLNDIRTQFLGVGATFQKSIYRFPFSVGIKDDRRFKQHDFGWSGMIGADMPRFRFGDYENRLDANYETDWLEKRRNESLTFGYGVVRRFYQDTSDSLRLSWQKGRRDYYISTAGEIESRDEDGLTAENVLVYRVSDYVKCRVEGRVVNRDLRIDVLNGENKGPKRKRKDLGLDGSVRMIWRTEKLNGNLLFRYAGDEERYTLAESSTDSPYSFATPDVKSLNTTLSLTGEWDISTTDTLSTVTSLQRYRYDTPDPDNYDDRDELRFRIDVRAAHRFSRELSARILASTHLFHLVYIYGEKSADNNWTRIFRLRPSLTWRPSNRMRLVQSVEVLSNYVDYDFESELSGIRSFVYRKFQTGDTLEVTATERSSFILYYKMELDENGKLVWGDWLEQKLTDRRSHTINMSLNFKPWAGFHFMPGYSYFYRRGFRYQLNTQAEQIREPYGDFKSHGPTLRLAYRGHRLALLVSGNTIVTRTGSSANQLLTRIDCKMSWLL